MPCTEGQQSRDIKCDCSPFSSFDSDQRIRGLSVSSGATHPFCFAYTSVLALVLDIVVLVHCSQATSLSERPSWLLPKSTSNSDDFLAHGRLQGVPPRVGRRSVSRLSYGLREPLLCWPPHQRLQHRLESQAPFDKYELLSRLMGGTRSPPSLLSYGTGDRPIYLVW
ncbi:hypothetical protein BDW67DRAFT_88431 [Aspergillus spinulosporus]